MRWQSDSFLDDPIALFDIVKKRIGNKRCHLIPRQKRWRGDICAKSTT
jgi:hypothetical protein